jgi:acetyl esterase/lipase
MSSNYKRSPYDAELVQFVATYLAGMTVPATVERIPMLRKKAEEMSITDDQLRQGGKVDFEERTVPGPKGAPEISLLICRPSGSEKTKSDQLLPCLYYMHGGGMIAGNKRSTVQFLVDWIIQFNIVFISVEYRLAPENPHPAPSEDCYAGLLWISEHAQDLGIDASQITVSGTSAGAGLAAAIALMARDRNGPKIQGQLLHCPMLDDRDQTVSTQQFDGIGIWDRQSNIVGWTALLGDKKGKPNVSPYAAPSRAQDLSNLPPAYIDVSSTEVFRDEDIDYAQRIWQAGGIAELHVWPGGYHGLNLFGLKTTLSKHALEASANWYRRLLASHKK